MTSHLDHLQVNVESVNFPFYKDLFDFLNWKKIADEEGMLAFLSPNEAKVWFLEKMKDARNDYDGIGMNHFGIVVSAIDEVDKTVTYLKERNIPALFDTPRHRPEFAGDEKNTYYQVMFESPDKILFEVFYSGPK